MNKQSMDLFMGACGLASPLQLVLQNPGKQEATRRLFYQPYVMLGRDPRSDWALDDGQVSRRHAYLQVIGGRVFVIDLGSRCGIYWGEERRQSGWLDGKTSLRMGPFSLWLLAADRDPEANPMESYDPLSQLAPELTGHPEVTLEFLNATGKQTSWRMNRTLVVLGRSPDCKVQLMSSTVSRLHCSLLRTPMGVWVVDLHGRGGIVVNGMPVRCAMLDDGDRLQVGKMLIGVRYQGGSPGEPGQTGTAEPAKTIPLLGSDTTKQGDGTDLIPQTELPRNDLVVATAPVPQLPGFNATELVATLTPCVDPSFLSARIATANDASLGTVLTPIMQQFAAMQQQMFDQFQQTIMMMVQMFSSLHRDQIGLIRDELDRLQQLTQELNDLQGELSQRGASAAEVQPKAVALGQAAAQTKTPDLETIAKLKAMLEASAPAEGPKPASIPGPKPAVREGGKRGSAPQKRAVPAAAKVPELMQPPLPTAVTSQKAMPTEKVAANAPAGELPNVQTDRDIHAWLCQRIATIQEERQGRWQKLASFILGRRVEGITS